MSIQSQCTSCTRCPLSDHRRNSVWGWGVENPTYLFIGSNPTMNNSTAGSPVSDRDGSLYMKWLKWVGIYDQSYITNLVKCPTPHGRTPFEFETAECWRWLESQIVELGPRAIILLGRAATDWLHPADTYLSHTPLRQVVGQIAEESGFLFMSLYHPSFVLRQPPQLQEEMNRDVKDYLTKLKDSVDEVYSE